MNHETIKRTKKREVKTAKPKNRRRLFIILAAIILVLIIARIILPYVVLRYANKTLATMHGYYGHVEDIDIALIRGAYQINDVYLNKVDSITGKESPFFNCDLIDLSIEWKALFHGSVVGELVFQTPNLKFIKEKVPPKEVAADTTDFRKLLRNFMPIKVNRFEIQNGILEYIDEGSNPKVDVKLTDTHVIATNLRNVYDKSELLPADVDVNAGLYEGTFDLNMKLNPLADRATFDLNARLDNTNLVLLNDFFKAYGKFDVNKGTFGLYTEVASKEGKFKGYVKPVIKDLDVVGEQDRNDNIFQKVWEEVVGATAQIFKNQKKDQVATKIPLEGDLSNPNADILTALVEILRNAFIQALYPSIDQEINIASVGKTKEENKSDLQKAFEKSKPKEKEKKDKKNKK